MVPLVGANRIIARRGLEMLCKTQRPGLQALKNVMGVRGIVNCSDVSFGIGPRLNAAGRMIHGEVVIDLLTTAESALAEKHARTLNQLNAERQETEGVVKEEAVRKVRALGNLPAGIVVWDREFHTGVIGIVAQRLVEAFYRPSIVMGLDTDGIFKGSVRGIKDFNVVESLAAVGTHLIKFGGHEGAGGFSVEESRVEKFAEAYIAYCEKKLKTLNTVPFVDADTEALLADVSIPLVDELKKFAPFGTGNPGPVLLIRDLKVLEVKVLKGTHLKAMLSDGKRTIAGLMWKNTSHPALVPGRKVDIACRPDTSSFNGRTELQANLQAIESSSS
jgi:single-stranded-DNA-specific exonuclease